MTTLAEKLYAPSGLAKSRSAVEMLVRARKLGREHAKQLRERPGMRGSMYDIDHTNMIRRLRRKADLGFESPRDTTTTMPPYRNRNRKVRYNRSGYMKR